MFGLSSKNKQRLDSEQCLDEEIESGTWCNICFYYDACDEESIRQHKLSNYVCTHLWLGTVHTVTWYTVHEAWYFPKRKRRTVMSALLPEVVIMVSYDFVQPTHDVLATPTNPDCRF